MENGERGDQFSLNFLRKTEKKFQNSPGKNGDNGENILPFNWVSTTRINLIFFQ
jgi:hypothetical protein